MAAPPDGLLDPHRYPAQYDEWEREEYEMPSYARKIDANHMPIKRAAQSFGVFVKDTYQFAAYDPGFPDQMWLIPWSPTHDVRMIEIKNGDEPLTPAEKAWAKEWRDNGGVYLVLHSLEEALRWLKAMRAGA